MNIKENIKKLDYNVFLNCTLKKKKAMEMKRLVTDRRKYNIIVQNSKRIPRLQNTIYFFKSAKKKKLHISKGRYMNDKYTHRKNTQHHQ